MRSGRTDPQDSAFLPPTPAPTHPDWPSHEEPGSSLTASAPVTDGSAPACTNKVWPPLRSESVKNKPSTMLSSNVQSIDLHMDCMVWRCWTMWQSNGCSTPVPRSSAAKQWFEQLAEKKKEHTGTFILSACFISRGAIFSRRGPHGTCRLLGRFECAFLSALLKRTATIAQASEGSQSLRSGTVAFNHYVTPSKRCTYLHQLRQLP